MYGGKDDKVISAHIKVSCGHSVFPHCNRAFRCALRSSNIRAGFSQTVFPCLQHKFDEKHGPTWHCIVGEDFKAAISHESKTFIFVNAGKSNVLLYRCG